MLNSLVLYIYHAIFGLKRTESRPKFYCLVVCSRTLLTRPSTSEEMTACMRADRQEDH